MAWRYIYLPRHGNSERWKQPREIADCWPGGGILYIGAWYRVGYWGSFTMARLNFICEYDGHFVKRSERGMRGEARWYNVTREGLR